MRNYPRTIKCAMCGNDFIATCPRSKYCGNREKKIGCSYKHRRKKQNARNSKLWFSSDKLKNYMREYSSKWRKKQRELKTDYNKRQKEGNKKWVEKNKEKIKENIKKWRIKNKDNIFFKNKQRLGIKRNIPGKLKLNDWDRIKRFFGYKCAYCKTKEIDLDEKYGKQFAKLTIDHAVPITKGGTNYMNNIQPLCVGCNSKKRDKDPKIILTAGTFDGLHFGHSRILKKARMLGDMLIVMLSTDEFNNAKGKKAIQTYEQRKEVLEAMFFVNKVVPEDSWDDKEKYIKEFKVDTFTIGSDWKNKFDHLSCKVVYLPRTRGISSTKLKETL